jgi:hypothetical protein
MCFSPEADLVAGTVVAVIGIDALRHVSSRRQLPLAVLPLLLAAHELDEAVVWWGLQGQVSWAAGHAAVVIYLAFAFCLPVIGPLAVMGIETDPRRRGILRALLGIGAVASAILLSSVFGGTVSAKIDGHHIAYAVNAANGTAVTVMYVVAACGALLASSDRRIVWFGISNLIAVMILAWITVDGLTSLWCTWAAVASVAIALYLRDAAPDRPRRVAIVSGMA